jgi:hypothetical protein
MKKRPNGICRGRNYEDRFRRVYFMFRYWSRILGVVAGKQYEFATWSAVKYRRLPVRVAAVANFSLDCKLAEAETRRRPHPASIG